MWSHYADYHKGICLKFDITQDPIFFLTPMKVDYSTALPHYNLFQDGEKDILKLIKTKFIDWSYEKEIRVLKKDDEIDNNNNAKNQRIFKFKNETLSEIIFGTKTSEESKEKIKEYCKKSGKQNMKFSQMKLKQGTYGLEEVDLTD